MRDKIQLKLLSTLGTREIYRWLPRGKYIEDGKYFYIHPYWIVTKTHNTFFAEFNQAIRVQTRQMRIHVDTMRKAAGVLSDLSEKNIIISNIVNVFDAMTKTLLSHSNMLDQARNNQTKEFIRNIGTFYIDNVEQAKTLLKVYMEQEGITHEKDAVEKLALEFQIDANIYTDPQIDGRTNWRQDKHSLKLLYSTDPHICFRGLNDQVEGYVKLENSMFLPLTYWRKMPEEGILPLNVPFEKPYPLFNLNLIAQYPHADIFISEHLAVVSAMAKIRTERIWSSWWGGSDAIFHVNWNCLRGRNVHYVITPHSKHKPEYQNAYRTAQKVCSCLEKIPEINLSFEQYTDNIFGASTFTKISKDQFVKIAETITGEKLPPVPSRGKETKFQRANPFIDIKNTDDIPQTKYILTPVIPENSITMLYSHAGLGKTWLALSMAYSISAGKDTFKRWKTQTPCSVFYIDSEMGESLMKRRLKVMESMYGISLKENKSFHCISLYGSDINLANIDDQGLIDRQVNAINKDKTPENTIKLIVLDNLSTLTEFNDSQKSWKNIFSWLKDYKDNGYSILIVHHANKMGDQRGSSVKSATVDNVICAKKIEYDGPARVMMELEFEKCREIFGLAKEPFTISLSPNAAKPHWKIVTKDISEENQNAIIEKRTNEGATVHDIAVELGLSKETIQKRKQKLKITRSYTRKKNEE